VHLQQPIFPTIKQTGKVQHHRFPSFQREDDTHTTYTCVIHHPIFFYRSRSRVSTFTIESSKNTTIGCVLYSSTSINYPIIISHQLMLALETNKDRLHTQRNNTYLLSFIPTVYSIQGFNTRTNCFVRASTTSHHPPHIKTQYEVSIITREIGCSWHCD
jgi:hypothetical protein